MKTKGNLSVMLVVSACFAAILMAIYGRESRVDKESYIPPKPTMPGDLIKSERNPDGTVTFSFNDGVVLHGMDAEIGTFSLSYPEMTEVTWLRMMSPTDRVKNVDYEIQSDHFPVFVMSLDYSPEKLEDMRVLSSPRPRQMVNNMSADIQRGRSPYAGLDVLHFPLSKKEVPEEIRNSPSVDYVEASGTPYEITINCQSECLGYVYSLRTRFSYGFRMPPVGISHAYDFIKSLDRLIVSWSPPGGPLEQHYQGSSNMESEPWPDFSPPAACANPSYIESNLEKGSPTPSFHGEGQKIRDKNGTQYWIDFQSGTVLRKGKQEENPAVLATNLHRANSMAVDEAGNVYVIDAWLGVVYKIKKGGERTVYAKNLRSPQDVVVDANGDIFVSDNSLAPIKKIYPDGRQCTVSFEANTHGGKLRYLALDENGNLYRQYFIDKSIKKFSPVMGNIGK